MVIGSICLCPLRLKHFKLEWNPSDDQLKSIDKSKQKRNEKYLNLDPEEETGDWMPDVWFHETQYVRHLKSIRG